MIRRPPRSTLFPYTRSSDLEESVENVEEALLSLEGMDTEIASKLATHGITTRDALADLAGDELVELTGMDSAKAQDLIMKARDHWFETAAETPTKGRPDY